MASSCLAVAMETVAENHVTQDATKVQRLPVVFCGGSRDLPSGDPWLNNVQEPAAQAIGNGDVIPVSGISSDQIYSPQPAVTYTGTPELPNTSTGGWHSINLIDDGNSWYRVDGWARGYYLNDQRIQWSGVEATFGAEGAVVPVVYHQFATSELTVLGEFYLNQPFNRNILVDSAERESYAGNWEINTFEISQLSLALRRGDMEFTAGKMVTPFGRIYFPLYTNSRIDAPFIRTEAIRWRETGILLRYDPGNLICDAAVTNGCDDLDTNSSKALVGRVGLQYESWAAGVSVKWQDGIGSENQKEFNNHAGADMMFRFGKWVLSGEAIYDEHGFRKPGFNPDDITWGRSIYYRDVYKGYWDPVSGVGYYANLGLELDWWTINLNYGEYYPEKIGIPLHDLPNRRGIVKVDYKISSCLNTYGVVMKENDGYIAQDGRPRVGTVVLAGMQYVF